MLPRPHRDCDRNGQHRKPNDRKAGNREHKIPYEPVKHFEMSASQRESPLKPEQDEKQASQQWVADVIHERKFWHIKRRRRDFNIGSWVATMKAGAQTSACG
jgi:hypothetical protein